jgi:copper(I)-binding protein
MKLAVLAALVIAAASAASLAAKPLPIRISHAWIAAPLVGAPTAAAYATVTNDGQAPDRLIGAATPAVETMQLHNTSMAGGIMRMRPATDGVVIAPGASLALVPGGGYHFMLTRPKRPLKIGERVPVTLAFARAGAVKAVFVVAAAAPGPAAPIR